MTDAPGRIRTFGLALRRRALYPLSYGRGDVSVDEPLSRIGARPRQSASHPMEVRAEIVRLNLAETFVIAARSQDRRTSSR